MSEQHTPGPWATDGRESAWNILGLEGQRVATVWRDGPKQPANARLIAAAPELLKACRTLATLHDADDWFATGRLAVEQARAAIEKATGEQL